MNQNPGYWVVIETRAARGSIDDSFDDDDCDVESIFVFPTRTSEKDDE